MQPDQFPYKSKTGWVYDSGDYETTMRKAMDMIGYDELRAEQKEKRERGELMGIGMSFFTEAVGAGPRKDMDILGLGMADGCELRVHPTGKAVVRLSVQTQGQGHETTFAQIVAEEIGIPPDDIDVVHGDTDQTPFGLGTYGSRSTPVSGAAAALVARKVRDKAQIIASGMLEVSVADLEWEKGTFHVKGDPSASVTIQDIAMRAHGAGDLPEGIEGGLDAQICYNPENLTYPYGAYICVVDIDPGTAVVKVRRFVAVDDCGTRINPMIIEGQVHGGLTDGVGMALMEMIAFDEDGNCLGGSLMDYLIPTALEVPALGDRAHRHAVAAPPDRRQGRRRVRHRRLAAGGGQRGGGRAGAVRRSARRHAADAVAGVGGHAGPRRRRRSETERTDERGRANAMRMDDSARRAAPRRRSSTRRWCARSSPPRHMPATRRSCCRDGTIEGFVGGQCAQNSVRKAALGALQTGESVLLRVLPDGDVHFPEAPGACVVVNPCLSGGALEIFLDPQVPAPLVRIVGATPIADALVAMCAALGYDVRRDGDGTTWRGTTAVVIASHGGPEAETIRAALDAGVGYIGLVASRVRGGVDPRRARPHRRRTAPRAHPVGLPIGAKTPAEIAVSILAEVIAGSGSGGVPEQAMDPGTSRPDRQRDAGHLSAGAPHLRAGSMPPVTADDR